MSTSSKTTLTPRKQADGTWYVEIIRPRIVYEHLGDFTSKASAQRWISENEMCYWQLESAYVPSKRRHRAPRKL